MNKNYSAFSPIYFFQPQKQTHKFSSTGNDFYIFFQNNWTNLQKKPIIRTQLLVVIMKIFSVLVKH